ncbi:hypothetical protein B0H13DRAFT_2318648 [Mycena leptocephala]|nr:hypothetical protein B0H13DRAFT_2318648 [Mycena leptocephala]
MSTGLTTVTHVQCLHCFKTVVAQEGIIDAKSGRIDPGSLSPNLQKTFSKWHVPDGSGSDNQFVNASLTGGSAWLDILSQAGDLTQSSVPMNTDLPSVISYLSFVDVYLMDRLALDPWWILPESNPRLNGSSSSGSNQTLSLHEIENALSSLVASAFWIVLIDETTPLPQGQCSRLNPKWFSAAACVGVLHVGLVLIYLALLAVWAAHHMEHKIIFRLDDQAVVSLITTVLTTTLGTVTYFHSHYTQTVNPFIAVLSIAGHRDPETRQSRILADRTYFNGNT